MTNPASWRRSPANAALWTPPEPPLCCLFRRRPLDHGSRQSRGARCWRRNVGLNIVLPHEQAPNVYVTPELSFQFHYFALRKMHFLLRARAVAVFPADLALSMNFLTADIGADRQG